MEFHHSSPPEADQSLDFFLAFVILFAVLLVLRIVVRYKSAQERDEADRAFALNRHPDRAHTLYRQYILEYDMMARANGRPDYDVSDADRYTANDLAWVRAWDMAGEQIVEWDYQEDWNQEHGRLLYNNALKSGRWHRYRH